MFTELGEYSPKIDFIGIPIPLHEDETEHLHCWTDYWNPFQRCFEDNDDA